jgi:hypothetical protein
LKKKQLLFSWQREDEKVQGEKYEGFSHYVIENIGSEIAFLR